MDEHEFMEEDEMSRATQVMICAMAAAAITFDKLNADASLWGILAFIYGVFFGWILSGNGGDSDGR